MYLIKKPFSLSLQQVHKFSEIRIYHFRCWNAAIWFSKIVLYIGLCGVSCVYVFFFLLVLYLFVCVLVKHVSVIVTPIKFLNLESWIYVMRVLSYSVLANSWSDCACYQTLIPRIQLKASKTNSIYSFNIYSRNWAWEQTIFLHVKHQHIHCYWLCISICTCMYPSMLSCVWET